MRQDEFWALIDAGVHDPQVVEHRIQMMSEQHLVDFYWTYQDLVDEITQDEYAEVFGASYSEGHHEDLAHWVVRQGKAYYDDVRDHPERFPTTRPRPTHFSYPSVAVRVYDERYGEPIREPDDPSPAVELRWADFWALIESGREDPDVVVQRIRRMGERELVNLWWRFQDAVDLLSTYDDEDEVVASWVVQQGKALYDRMLADPGRMPAEVPAWHGPSYRGEVVEAYDDRYGRPIPDPDHESGGHIEIEPDAFWDLIDSGREDPTVVERALEAMSEPELVEFHDRYEQAVADLTDEPYSDNAAHDGVHSEDHHLDIAEWIVSRGRRFYALHLADPKLFPLEPGHDDPTYSHHAAKLYRERYGVTIRAPEDPPPASAAPAPHRKKGRLSRLFGHGDP